MEFSCTSIYAPSLNDIASTFNDKTACLTSLFKYMQWYLPVLDAIKLNYIRQFVEKSQENLHKIVARLNFLVKQLS